MIVISRENGGYLESLAQSLFDIRRCFGFKDALTATAVLELDFFKIDFSDFQMLSLLASWSKNQTTFPSIFNLGLTKIKKTNSVL